MQRTLLICLAGTVSADIQYDRSGQVHDVADYLHLLQTKVSLRSADQLHSNQQEISERATLPPIAVKPMDDHPEGLGSMLQNYRKSLAYALALDLPWVGRMVNTHDKMDYTKFLGLCQPLCDADLDEFEEVSIDALAIDLESGSFKLPSGLTKPTVVTVSEIASLEYDEGNTNRIAGIQDRFVAQHRRTHQCPLKPFLTFHFRWGDLASSDYDHPSDRAMGMSTAADLIKKVLKVCNFDVKVMSEGEDVRSAFAQHFSGSFEYVDGYQSSLKSDLLSLSCSTVLIGGTSSFTVLGALLSQGVVLAPKRSAKYQNLDFVLDSANISMTDLRHALKKAAPGACTTESES
mmetsp:Transcript_63655/g.111044  ORF Transcript_63655/g.111044 Transcript_63655/m.111044 type:complete len:347 (+) Transcript_63655:89-1129(+)